jgi:hypothetical protein
MSARTRRAALYAIGAIALLASIDALAHSYTGLYGWAVHHRLGGWQALSWPAEIDVFLVAGELALYVAYLDAWPACKRAWPWLTAVTGLVVSVAGNIGHVQPLPAAPVTLADRLTAATSPVTAFSGLMIGLLVLKMNQAHAQSATRAAEPAAPPSLFLRHSPLDEKLKPSDDGNAAELTTAARAREDSLLLADAQQIISAAQSMGEQVSQRALAAQLRERGHRFSNGQLQRIVSMAGSTTNQRAA